ncbi:MAG: oligoendopeptidase F [Lachnospiraceae bacterium]|nr:oligoendopeptidase F [Lachnospiraceae bacterium]
MRTREEIPSEYKWAIEDLYENDECWREDYERLKADIPGFARYQGRLDEGAGVLFAMQRACDELNMLAEKVYVYANQRLHENTDNGVYQNLANLSQGLLVELSQACAWVEPELLALPEGTIEGYLEENPELSVYRQYFENIIRQKTHVLPKEQEALLASLGGVAESPKDIFSMFNNADLRFPPVSGADGEQIEVTHGNFITLMQSGDRELRRSAFQSLYSTYASWRNTLAATYRANVKQEVFFAKARKYGSDLEAALDGSHIPVTVYDNLIDAVHGALPLLHRYMGLRKKLLGVEELHLYDVYVPMTEDPGEKIPFEEAKRIVLEGLAPLGEEYLGLLREGFTQGWIDVCENQGKRSGAYSWGAYGMHPYVLLNYQESLNDVFTLAHEMGHALHSWYSDENQPYIYAGYKIFVAEVASTCNEALLIRHLIDHAEDSSRKAYLINYLLEQFRTTLYRQTMFAEFEKITHGLEEQGETLSADRLCEIYYDLNCQYFGEETTVDREIGMEWARIPHFYTPFYVYQYATGFSAAMALSARILREGETAVMDYKRFLKGGSSQYPLDLLHMAGVDMERKEPVEEALEVFKYYLDEMEELTGQ